MRSFLIGLLLLLAIPLLAIAAHVEWVTINGAIGPVAHKMIGEGLQRAEKDSAKALIIQLDTPGGLLSTTRLIAKDLLNSTVPVVVYVAPSGSRAGSAGVFLTLAADVAAMAPGTNIGAAHPVGIGGAGSDSSNTISGVSEKVTNDAAAFARTMAEKHHKNIAWAERAVRESVSATETEALALNVIDFIAASRSALLDSLNGRAVELPAGPDTLRTAGAAINETKMTFRLKILDFIADPNIVYILMLLGIYGLFFELYNPGAILPGIVGGVSLILAFFSLQLLPLNWAGLLLILFAVILFVLEIKIVSHGMLTIGGVVSMIFGSLMLFNPAETGVRVGIELIILASISTALFFLFVVGMGLRAQKRKVTTGKEGLIGEIGTVSVLIAPKGKITVHGEWWNAESPSEITVGTKVRVTGMRDMILQVEPVDKSV
jgi:membrane-bound serine protease (ClpP class)